MALASTQGAFNPDQSQHTASRSYMYFSTCHVIVVVPLTNPRLSRAVDIYRIAISEG